MELQRGYCTLCSSNTKVVVPPQALVIINMIKKVLADQLNVREFSSINSTLRVCPICLQNILMIKTLGKRFQRHMALDSDGCCLCEEDGHLVSIKDHNYLRYLLEDTRYEDNVANCYLCLDCIKCLELMRNIRTNLIKRHPQLAPSLSNIKDKSSSKTPTQSPVSKRGGRKSDSRSKKFLSHLKTLSRTKYNLNRFRRDYTLLHKICYVKLDNADLLHLKRTYKPEIDEHRSRRKSATPKKDYKRMLSPADDSPPQNFFKIKVKLPPKPQTRHQEKEKNSPPSRSSRPKRSPAPKSSPPRTRSPLITRISLPKRISSARKASPPPRKSTTPVKRARRDAPQKKKKVEEVPEEPKVRPRRIRKVVSYDEDIEGKKLIVNVSRLSTDENNDVPLEDDDAPIIVPDGDPLAIPDPLAMSDDEGGDPGLKTPTKASRKMLPDTGSGRKRKSVTFNEEKNVEIEYGTYDPKEPDDTALVKKSSLKKSTDGNESDEEQTVEYLEHVRNNVEDVFNSLKSNEPAAPIKETVSNIISSIGSSDEEDADEKSEENSSEKEKYAEEPNTNISTDTERNQIENSSKKRKRSESPNLETQQDENIEDKRQVKKPRSNDISNTNISETNEDLEDDSVQNYPVNQENEEAVAETVEMAEGEFSTAPNNVEQETANIESIEEEPAVENGDFDRTESAPLQEDNNIEPSSEDTQNDLQESEEVNNESQFTENEEDINASLQESENVSVPDNSNIDPPLEGGVENNAESQEESGSPCEIHASDINESEMQNAADEENPSVTIADEENASDALEEESETQVNGSHWRSDYEERREEDFDEFKTVDSCGGSVNGDEPQNDTENEEQNNSSVNYEGVIKFNSNQELVTQTADN